MKFVIFIILLLSLVICSYIVKHYYIEGNTPMTTTPSVSTTPTLSIAEIMRRYYQTAATGNPSSYRSRNIIPTDTPSGTTPPIDENTIYNATNYNVTYHTDSSGAGYENTLGTGYMWIVRDGKLVAIPYSDVSGTNLYYEPGSYRFGPSSYIPNYEESVYLSRLTKISQNSPYNPSSTLQGFCEKYKNYPDKIEEMCKSMSPEECASTNCCALLGGVKCTYGDANGPKIKANYSDKLIANKDLYYYQGKCYGNCN
jgi:hypothetical protein